jgi:hypothetical protein
MCDTHWWTEMVLIPLAAGLLAAGVAYGRWRLAPLRGR